MALQQIVKTNSKESVKAYTKQRVHCVYLLKKKLKRLTMKT